MDRTLKTPSTPVVAACWLLVLIPLGWGVYQSVVKSLPLFRTPEAAKAKP